MKYYSITDIQELTGKSYTTASRTIVKLNKQYKKEYPNAMVFKGQILKTFFDEKMGIKDTENQKR